MEKDVALQVSRSGVQRKSFLDSREGLAYLMLSPALVIIFIVLVVPLFYSLYLSFQSVNMLDTAQSRWVGFANYWQIFSDPASRFSLFRTLFFTFFAVIFEVLLGVALALLLNKTFRGNRVVRTFILVPMMVSQVVAALCWLLILDANGGLLNYVAMLFGIDKQVWLGQGWAMSSIILVEVWQHTPFVTLIILAGLQSLPKEVLEAASVDGASAWRQLWRIVLPLIKPIILVALVFRTMFALRVFTPVWVLTGGGPADSTLVAGVDIYRTAFRYHDFGMATALSWVLILVTTAITLFYMHMLRRDSIS